MPGASSPSVSSTLPVVYRLAFPLVVSIVALNVIVAARLPSASHASGVGIGLVALLGLYVAAGFLFRRRPIPDVSVAVRTQVLALVIVTVAVALAASVMSHWEGWSQQVDESFGGKREVPVSTVADLDRYLSTFHNELVIDGLPADCEALPLDYWGPNDLNVGWNCNIARVGQPSAQAKSTLSERQLDALRVLITHLDDVAEKVADGEAVRLSVGGDRYGRFARHVWLDYRIAPLETLLPAVDTLCPEPDRCITLKTLLRPQDLGWQESVERARAGEPLPDHLLRDSHRRKLESELAHLIDYEFGRDLRQMWQTIRQAQGESTWTIRDIDDVRMVSFEAGDQRLSVDVPNDIALNNVGPWRRLMADLALTDSGQVTSRGQWVSTDTTQRPATLVIDSGYYWSPPWLTLAPVAVGLALLIHWLVQIIIAIRAYRAFARRPAKA
ncbi:hypothetical protein [Salinicola aestuarinus]|uniref:hypothetical protein n=1 Tax=Salinicola aestuarinus TaxID=1949082 RepID=UPI001300B665|nr:hypothetical protein [Salinicola aestuarinus]